MRKIITTAVVALAAFAASPAPASADYCAEDAPCFNWTQHGNGARGITLKSGKHAVVTVCQFKRADARGRIDWAVTPKLKGDRAAKRARCGFNVQNY